MSAAQIRVGLVGLDHWYIGRAILRELSQSDRAKAVVVAHSDERYGRPEADSYGIEYTQDYLSVATRSDVDLVVTACPSSINPEVVKAAAAAGKPVLSGKPFAMNIAAAREVVEAVNAAGVPFISYDANSRVSPAYRAIREWIATGQLGRVMNAVVILRSTLEGAARPWPDAPIGPTWWRDPNQVPGGGWIDHSIYAIDRLRWLLGAEVTEIGGLIARLRHPDEPLEDWGTALAAFDNGAVATIEVTWHAEPGADSGNQFHLLGTKGQVRQMGWRGPWEAMWYEQEKRWQPAGLPDAPGSLLEHMLDVMQGKTDPVATVEDSFAALAACLAFYDAAEERCFRSPARL